MKALMEQEVKDTQKPKAEAFSPDYSFDTPTGRIDFDYKKMDDACKQMIVDVCVPKILKLEGGVPVLTVTREEAARNKCIECLACEIETQFAGYDAVRIDLPIEGFEAAVKDKE